MPAVPQNFSPAAIAGLLALVSSSVAVAQETAPATSPAPDIVEYAPPPRDPQAASLTIGDAAPALHIMHWLRGETVESFQRDRIYIVEFWATWCGPCIRNMPHLSRIQREHGEHVTVIGVSDESLQTVVAFLTKRDKDSDALWSDVISYTLTTDPDGSTQRDYMAAAGQGGLPTAFIIGRDGRIEWIGHPKDMDPALSDIVAGKWDRAACKAAFEKDMEPAHRAADISRRIQQARAARDWEAALVAFDELIALGEDQRYVRTGKFRFMLNEVKDYPRAYAYGRELLKFAWADDAVMLNQIAWFIMDDPIEQRDVELALKAATRANELSQGQDPEHLSRLAQIRFTKGDPATAIDLARKAVNLARQQEYPADALAEMQADLKQYEQAVAAGGSQGVPR